MSIPFSEIRRLPYKKWYQFGHRSPEILYKRLRKKHKPIFRARMMWQRARRGYSVEDCWGLDHHLAHVIVGGVRNLREWKTGYPSEFDSWETWDVVLAKIEGGFQAFIEEDGWFFNNSEQEVKFKEGMALFAEWFGSLWD